jgi:hypothetical protein
VDRKESSTSVFHKTTFPDLYSNFASFCYHRYKTSLINILIYRAYKICSTNRLLSEQLGFICDTLYKNCFPKKMVQAITRTFLNKITNLKPKKITVPKLCIRICLPYMGWISSQVKRNLTKLVNDSFLQVNLELAFTSRKIASLFPMKDKIP